MDKLTERLSFRITSDNLDYLKNLAESDERTTSFAINKMIQHFKAKGIKNLRKIKQHLT